MFNSGKKTINILTLNHTHPPPTPPFRLNGRSIRDQLFGERNYPGINSLPFITGLCV